MRVCQTDFNGRVLNGLASNALFSKLWENIWAVQKFILERGLENQLIDGRQQGALVNKVSAEKCFHWKLFTEHFLANIISKLFGEIVVQKAVQKYVQKKL